MSFRAGVARTTINPPMGSFLVGYLTPGRLIGGCSRIHDDLTATALVLENGSTRLAIVALDLLGIGENLVAEVRQYATEHFDIPPEHLLIACSHTHAAPAGYADAQSRPRRRAYVAELTQKIIAIIGQACEKMSPVNLFAAQGEAFISMNRRKPSIPVEIDRSVNVLQLRTAQTKPLATIVNFACHPVLLGPNNRAVSADWVGAMRKAVEQNTHGMCLFLQGAAADINPKGNPDLYAVDAVPQEYAWGNHNLEDLPRYGQAVAKAVLDVLPKSRPIEGSILKGIIDTVWLPVNPQRLPNGKERSYRDILREFSGIPGWLADPVMHIFADIKLNFQRGEDGRWQVPLPLQALHLGDALIMAHGSEPFNAIGRQIKTQSPTPVTLFAGYSNGLMGYVPTAEAVPEGGYEVEIAPYIYKVPGIFDPICEARVISQSLEMMQKIIS